MNTAAIDNYIRLGSYPLSRKIGYAMGISSMIIGILYLLGLVINLATSGSVYPSGSDVRIISAILAILWNVVLVILFTALRKEAEPSRAVLGELGLVFGILVCGASCSSWLAGLIVSPRLLQVANPALAALFDPYNLASFAYALEHLAWGLFFGLAAVFASLALKSGGFVRWACWSLLATGILSLAHFLGVILNQEVLIALGYVSWGVVLPISSALVAGLFRRKLKELSVP